MYQSYTFGIGKRLTITQKTDKKEKKVGGFKKRKHTHDKGI